jgi:hypothetical protein
MLDPSFSVFLLAMYGGTKGNVSAAHMYPTAVTCWAREKRLDSACWLYLLRGQDIKRAADIFVTLI